MHIQNFIVPSIFNRPVILWMKRSQLQCIENLKELKNISGLIIVDDLHDAQKCKPYPNEKSSLRYRSLRNHENTICAKRKSNVIFPSVAKDMQKSSKEKTEFKFLPSYTLNDMM